MFFIKFLSLLPLSILYLFSDLIYFLFYYTFRYRVNIVKNNLRNSFPEKNEKEIKEITKKFYKNLSDLVVEIIKTMSISEKELSKRVNILNPELPLTALSSGQSIIVLAGHLCNWEWLLAACQIKVKYPTDAVYKPLSNKFSDECMVKIRSPFGAKPLAMKDTLREQVRKKNTTHTLAMLGDQTPLRNEIQYWTTFFNQDTPYYVGADKIGKC